MASRTQDSNPEKKILKRFQEEDLRLFYILYGPERYFIRRSLEILEQRILLLGGTREFSIFRYHGSEVNVDELIDTAQTVPFLGERRLILVNNADDMKDKEAERLCDYLKNPCSFACLVLICSARFPDKSRNRDKEYLRRIRSQEKGACVEFPRLKDDELNIWIHEIAKGKGVRLSQLLLDKIKDASGNDLEAISNEIEKLSLISEKGPDPGEGEIDSLLCLTKEEPIYMLTDALLLRGSREEALRYVNRLLDQGELPLVILSWICGGIRRIWRVRETVLKGESLDPVFRKLRVFKDSHKKDYLNSARLYTEERICEVVHHLLQTDRALKSSRLNPRHHLERLVLGICSQINTRDTVSSSAR